MRKGRMVILMCCEGTVVKEVTDAGKATEMK